MNSNSRKVYQWKADDGIYTNAVKTFDALIEGNYTDVEFLKPDESVLHKTHVPGAAATLGTYATRAGKMLREGCTWEAAATPRKSTDFGSVAISLTESVATFTAGDLTVTVDRDHNVHVPTLRAQSNLTAIKLAQGFILEYCRLGNHDWLAKFIKPRKIATAGRYAVELPLNATVADAQVALVKLISESVADGSGTADDFRLLADVKLTDAGSVDGKVARAWITKS